MFLDGGTCGGLAGDADVDNGDGVGDAMEMAHSW